MRCTSLTLLPARDDDLEWLLCVARGLLGQRSGNGAIVAHLKGGGSGPFDSSAAEALVERTRPHVARARRLGAVWALVALEHRKLLEAHYRPRGHWPPGVVAHLGELAAVRPRVSRASGDAPKKSARSEMMHSDGSDPSGAGGGTGAEPGVRRVTHGILQKAGPLKAAASSSRSTLSTARHSRGCAFSWMVACAPARGVRPRSWAFDRGFCQRLWCPGVDARQPLALLEGARAVDLINFGTYCKVLIGSIRCLSMSPELPAAR